MITTKINQDATAFHQRRGEVPLESRSQVPSEDVLSRNPFMATLRTVRRERLWSPTLDPSSRLLPLFPSSSSLVGHASGRSILPCSCVCLSIALLYKVIIVIQLTPVGFIVFICSFFCLGVKVAWLSHPVTHHVSWWPGTWLELASLVRCSKERNIIGGIKGYNR